MVLRSLGATCLIAGGFLFDGGGARAADCPTSKKPGQAFQVSIGSRTTVEVYRLDTGETRAVTRFSGGAISEQTYFQGLVRIEQIDDGRRTTFTPKTDLKTLFPLKVGQSHRADFDVQSPDGKKRVLHAEYKVVGKDRIAIGPCRYEVFKIEHSNSFREGPLIFIDTDWYAPEIRLIVAREFKQGKAGSVINKYDALSALDARTGK